MTIILYLKSSFRTQVETECLAMRRQVTMGPEGVIMTSMLFNTLKHNVGMQSSISLLGIHGIYGARPALFWRYK